MVKLFSLTIIRRPVDMPPEGRCIFLKGSYDLTSFGTFQRGSVKEFMQFLATTIVERTEPAGRQSVKENAYVCHVYVRADGLSAVLISDADYPNRVAHTLMSRVLDKFSEKYDWKSVEVHVLGNYKELDLALARYQNPLEADAFTRLQAEIDGTRDIVHSTMEDILKRGEKVDELVQLSESISESSKLFYKTARKHNSACCNF